MSVNAVLRECAVDLLETEPKVTVEQIVGCAYRRHGDEFAAKAEQMVLASARTIVANLLRDLTDDDGDEQLAFDGFGGLPSAIAVQSPDGTYYVRADKATWPELLAGRDIRAENVARAQVRLDAYDSTLDMLRPLMESNPSLTVAQAVARMSEAA